MTTGELGSQPHDTHPAEAPDSSGPRTEEDVHAADAHHVGGGHDHEHIVGGHAHEDDHSSDHDETALGPIDWTAWLVSAIGVGAGAAIAAVLFVAIQHG